MTDVVRGATWAEVRQVLANPTIQVGLAGPPGIGKTYHCFQVGRQVKRVKGAKPRRIEKLQFHSEYSPAEAMGMYVPAGDKFMWEPGPVDLCYSEGGLLILDEINEASGPMKTYLYGLLDRGPGGTISYVGRTFRQSDGYQVVATMNGYPDQGELPPALLDRFDAWFIMTAPSEEQLQVLDPDLRDICKLAYETADDPMAGPEVTFRLLMGLQKLRTILPIEVALHAACNGNAELAGNLLEVLQISATEQADKPTEPEEDYCLDCDSPAAECICPDEE